MSDDRRENETLDYQPHPLVRPRGPSAKQVADMEKARCFEHHKNCGTLGVYYEQFPMDAPPGWFERGRSDR